MTKSALGAAFYRNRLKTGSLKEGKKTRECSFAVKAKRAVHKQFHNIILQIYHHIELIHPPLALHKSQSVRSIGDHFLIFTHRFTLWQIKADSTLTCAIETIS